MSRTLPNTSSVADTGKRDIPSLDGLRAFSILLVILSHSAWYFPAWVEKWLPFRMIIGNGRHGVAVFFVISGFLITTLLIRERERSGTISLRLFYFRRTFRIFPPFYLFMLVMGLLWAARLVPEDPLSFIVASTFTWCYYPFAHGYEIAHTWSLAIEEQFYLFWPLALLLWQQRKQNVKLALSLIIVMPFVRVAVYFAFPSLRGHEGFMLQEWTDSMMVGCLLALIRTQPRWQQWHRRYLNGWTAGALAITGLFVVPLLGEKLPHSLGALFLLSIGFSITALCVGGVLVYVTENRDSLWGAVLNYAPIRYLGLISYSLYLWQQIFTARHMHLLPWGFVYALAAAILSYLLVERPSLRLRGRIEQRLRLGKAVLFSRLG